MLPATKPEPTATRPSGRFNPIVRYSNERQRRKPAALVAVWPADVALILTPARLQPDLDSAVKAPLRVRVVLRKGRPVVRGKMTVMMVSGKRR